MNTFALSDTFLAKYKGKQPEWGPIGLITYKRTYSRPLCNKCKSYNYDTNLDDIKICSQCKSVDFRTEEWWETLQRVVEGTYNIQKDHCERLKLPWNPQKAQHSAQEMYSLIWDFKFLPPGRGLWMMGTDFVTKRGGASLNNCSFISTKEINLDFAEPFTFLMDMSMLGVGVGGDCKGAELVKIKKPKQGEFTFVVEDTREGWVDLVRTTLNAYVGKGSLPKTIDYSQVRPYGSPIKGFGGTASGPGPLQDLVEKNIPRILDGLAEEELPITGSAIVDLFNAIGRCVVSGNVRRSAEIIFGLHDDVEFLELKDEEKSEEHKFRCSPDGWRWASNNAVFATIGMNYENVAKRTAKKGGPGYFWLDTARKYGRLADPPDYADILAEGANPCSEQTLESYELCCVAGNTKILTSYGYLPIKKLINREVEIWNGLEWSSVRPFIAAQNKDLYRVHLSDGSYLDVTDNHEWSVKFDSARKFQKLTTLSLEPGMVLESTEVNYGDVKYHTTFNGNAYAWGFFAGDGYLDQDKIMISLHGEKDYKTTSYFESIGASFYKEQHPDNYSEPFRRVNLTKQLYNLELAEELNNKKNGIPDIFFSLAPNELLEFISGWIDSDGNLCKQVNTDNYRIFGCESKIRDMQLLLRQVGVNHASVYKMSDAGETVIINGQETNRTYDLWVCYIPSYEASILSTTCKIKTACRFGDRFSINNAHPNGAKIDKARKQHIESIEKLEEKHTVYCFSEDKRHMGMFGNCLTYQCLVETFPARHATIDEYKRTLKFAYLYAKTVTLLPTHNARTNAVMLRNRRIGTSQSGIVQAFTRHGVREHFNWCDQGYRYLRDLDNLYSRWLCIPRSIKITSVKPSGTVSLLCGATPGVHFPYAEYYWRTMRFDSGSELLESLRKSGYRIEKGEGETTSIVYFPVKEDNFFISREDVSMWQQLEIVAQMQHWWADNQVSVTITFKPEEAKEIPRALELYENRLKSVSFLPLVLDKVYEHAPIQPMTKDEYEVATKKLKNIQLKKVTETQGFENKFCDGDTCVLNNG